jgi:hypothetical protein
MDILDVNILLYAFNQTAPQHSIAAPYVQSLRIGGQPFPVPSLVFSGFLRIATTAKMFSPPATMDDALTFCDQLQSLDHCVTAGPGERHWAIFTDLCKRGNARASLVSDAYLAAIAIELGGILVTADRGMARWPGLNWPNPFEDRHPAEQASA